LAFPLRTPSPHRKNITSKQHEYPVKLDNEAQERPAHQNQRDANRKRERAFPFLFPREEGECFCRADDERQAD
jgi:hypothetical protein